MAVAAVVDPPSVDSPIGVLVVDDHPMLRDGIAALVERQADMSMVGEAGDGLEAVRMFTSLRPDVTLIDVQMPRLGGIEAVEEIRRVDPAARLLVLTTYPGDAQAIRALRAGATGYLLKSCIRKELLDAIRAVHRGRRTVSAEVAENLAVHALDERLTGREVAILELVADGRSNRQIASDLSVSADTIKAHLKNIFGKLDVGDRTQAVTVATRRGFMHR
jgi:DNA-binding NarL/FixJ family response regulator